jgi:uncharacterized protein YbjT (DUF2867 family)
LARCLIIGCGCRGRTLASGLLERGHTVRGTSRDAITRAEIEAAGAEAVAGDPDRISTLIPAFEHVSVACVLLGSATGSDEQLAALHGTRLEMLVERMLDTTVRGILYEAAGSVDPGLLKSGAARVRARCERSLIPYVLLDSDPSERELWLRGALAGVQRLLTV